MPRNISLKDGLNTIWSQTTPAEYEATSAVLVHTAATLTLHPSASEAMQRLGSLTYGDDRASLLEWGWTYLDPVALGDRVLGYHARAERWVNTNYRRFSVAVREEIVDNAAARLSQPWPSRRRSPVEDTLSLVPARTLGWFAWEMELIRRGADAARRRSNAPAIGMGLWSADDPGVRLVTEHIAQQQADTGIGDDPTIRIWQRAAADAARLDLSTRARAGAARVKAQEVESAVRWILLRGAEDDTVQDLLAQDPALLAFHALQATQPATWGLYPVEQVPTAEVLADHRELSPWHDAVRARHNDLLTTVREGNAASRVSLILQHTRHLLASAWRAGLS